MITNIYIILQKNDIIKIYHKYMGQRSQKSIKVRTLLYIIVICVLKLSEILGWLQI